MKIKRVVESFTQFKISKKTLAIFLASAFFLSIIPLFILSFYNRAAADDYSYSVLTVHAWRETGSIFQVLLAACETVRTFYNVWQGTFSAVFLFSLQPAIFGNSFYFITTFIMLGMLIISTGYLLHVLIVQYLKADKWTWVIVSSIVLFLSIQLIPNANEAFYWYNGNVYYTFFYSVMLFMLGLILKLLKTSSKKWFIIRSIEIVLLAIFLSGGNYVTGLISIILLALLSGFLFVKKQKTFWIVLSALIIMITGMLVSGLAPGNVYRAASLTPMAPLTAIVYALYNGLILLAQWTNLVIFAFLMLLFPLFLSIVKNTKFSFKYPTLVILGSYALFSAQLTPSLFAMGDPGSARLMDIYYFAFVLLVIFNFFYLVGWLNSKVLTQDMVQKETQTSLSLVFLLVVVVIGFVGLMKNGVVGLKTLPTLSALISLIKGDARTFAVEMDARIALFENPTIMDVTVTSLSVIPPLFHPETLSTNALIWPNVDIARYYDKDSIALVLSPSERFSLLVNSIRK